MNANLQGPPIVLASGSVSRARMLTDAGVPFTAEPPQVDESLVKDGLKAENATALDTAETLAELKAVKVSRRYPQALVIGADQILDFNGEWFDKPPDLDHAKAQLLALAGKTHSLATVVVVALGGTRIWHHREQPSLTMRAFGPDFVDSYIKDVGEAVLNSVGAYHLEGRGVHMFNRIDGDFFSILGLPLLPLLAFLREHKAVPV